uniref:Uncharacterized protein n=1 Tax=Panagrolaimus sp. ES5 TaxID=591445 RepID=A0AC34GT90_9BILA
MPDPHYALGTYYHPSEVISFTLIGMAVGAWLNNSKAPLFAYRLTATTASATTPMEVIVEQETQIITTTTNTALVEEKGGVQQSKRLLNKSMVKTKSATASAATPTKGN